MKQKKPKEPFDIAGLMIIIISCAFIYGMVKLTGYGSQGYSPVKSEPTRNTSSFVRCQMEIERHALDKSEVDVPLLKGLKRSDGSWEYYWGASTKPLRMPNKLGQKLIVEGACVATEEGKIITLIIDGNQIK